MSETLSIISQDNRSAITHTSAVGTHGEMLAAEFIKLAGFQIVMSNFKAPIGRNTRGAAVTGEIDLIALEGDLLCFIEVKTRESADFAGPLANVNLRKQRQITRTAHVYKRLFGLTQMEHRFDAVSVLMEKGLPPQIELFRSFWTEAKFKKRSWSNDVF
ncbi:MAG: YraN family protein [Pyrinomonadaceae bacterium]